VEVVVGDKLEAREMRVRPVFADTYAESYAPLVRLAHLLTGSNEVGEEIVQDAFARVFRSFDQLDNPGGYARTCVVNGCRTWQRRRVVERRILQKLAGTASTEPAPGSELFDALAVLPFRQRTALVLRFYEDRSTEEIAAALGCRPGTAKSLVSRGLARLREEIER
jgi:RNA polymerase sigma-70 factor (sigma-E family)